MNAAAPHIPYVKLDKRIARNILDECMYFVDSQIRVVANMHTRWILLAKDATTQPQLVEQARNGCCK